ncbi:barnase inhibitor [Chromobacterium sp. ATCC 53434]|uniref:barstar family protein n=1 Tax=Chromobacterium sp. (strain ATCC 53434 / SC 14030) TaxID=2059672 RepID=UPI000C78F871|nr:barstar family protein [Chromobacterium sp. ATCC 53434]AUH52243.1 barnase inhibitor [Chromobacterium sp. ATCC 53434]
MPLSQCELHAIASLEQLFDQLSRQLPLPPHFGRNLDALYDCLANEVPGPLRLVWHDAAAAERALGADVYATVLDILQTVADERDDVALDIRR